MIADCPNESIATGLCAMHYMRRRRTGDPTTKGTPGPKAGPKPAVSATEASEIASLRQEVAHR